MANALVGMARAVLRPERVLRAESSDGALIIGFDQSMMKPKLP
jgi:hypothetical protein